ncbi:GIY-YIG nuclease family protein [Pseudomonas sp. PDM16]|uniref:GIY-YIG nuclease family protein n=1 Tax=Pseudomonas sp. PDM16 TaxID=2769292 RepID=UPI00177C05D2|nr:GIY-YIG nuclease family protein [Pseudomonas sp. PDM16]MBD9415899.1 GIY-YIG nuclease family protein [Pseudomonas sp. PDM16]
MANIQDLIRLSAEFFQRHWDHASGQSEPEWKHGWSWKGSLPHYEKGGVYALFDTGGEVVYIGLGASKGGGRYIDRGISRRLINHVVMRDPSKGKDHYMPKPNWLEVNSIGAIGFPRESAYLALALEAFLIGELNPPRNRQKRIAAVSQPVSL